MTARHLFLTGEKGVGKSTLIDRLLSRFPGRVGGFRTVRVDTVRPGEATVHLLRVSGGEQPGEGNLLFSCAAPGADMALRFETLGRAALSGCGRCGKTSADGHASGRMRRLRRSVFTCGCACRCGYGLFFGKLAPLRDIEKI